MAFFKCAFPDQALALAVGPLGVLFGNRQHARHAAMAPFPAQPPQEPALQQLGVEPVGLGPAMLPREVAPFQWTVCQLAVYVLVMAACMSAS